MNNEQNNLTVIDGETLMDTRLPPRSFCIQTLLPEGISMLGGAPKIGKSWMVLDIGVRVAKGQPIWNLSTQKGTVLYLALEDTLARLQERLCKLTDEAPPNLFFAIASGTLADDLCAQIESFIAEHPDTALVIIDTFQLVRGNMTDTSYASDYEEVRKLKALADKHGISLLLVHHLRKQDDRDPLNKLSGTTGISGAMDAVFILDVSKRHARGATLFCTGRDIESREMELMLSRDTCAWELISDTLEEPELTLPGEMSKLIELMKGIVSFNGGNTEFAKKYSDFSGASISAKSLKQMMNRWRYPLEENGVYFKSSRSNGQRFIEVRYSPLSAIPSDESDVQDATDRGDTACVLSVPCVPVES